MQIKSDNSFGCKAVLFDKIAYYSLEKLGKSQHLDMDNLPFSIKILLESALHSENGREVTAADIFRLASYNPKDPVSEEIPFCPARVLMQDFTGVPAVVDLAALRSALARQGGDPAKINPVIPVDLIIDHSIQVDYFGMPEALRLNSEIEFQRNKERYEFLHWGQKTFDNFTVVPPASGICHQVNLEYLGKVVQLSGDDSEKTAYTDTLVGTDSHTPMINGLGIIGWGVGGIEAEAAMLGQPLYMLTPEVIGFRLTGKLQPGITATDLVLTVTQILRKKGVVGKFVEFFGQGLSNMPVPDRATIANMAPEYGATIGYFPVDHRTLEYLRQTGRSAELIELVERYCQTQGIFRTDSTPDPQFKDIVELDLSTVEASIAGPKRPQDRSSLRQLPKTFRESLTAPVKQQGFGLEIAQVEAQSEVEYPDGSKGTIHNGDVLISAITSCTNTSNPSVMIAAGLLAKKAVEAGLTVKPYVKTSLAPGSKVVTDYLTKTGLLPYLEKLGFHIVGYGCTTCIGNSGPLPKHLQEAVEKGGLITAAVLSGNRNFSGRINPHTKASFLMSPPLVVALALAGRITIDLTSEPLGYSTLGKAVFLKDIWPADAEIAANLNIALDAEAFHREYESILTSNPTWNAVESKESEIYQWDENSDYIREPTFFTSLPVDIPPIRPVINARVLVKAGDSITTDHISPAGNIAVDSSAGNYLISRGIEPKDFNSYGSRRGNDQVMTRGTFANITFRNQLAGGKDGGWTTYLPTGEIMSIYDASRKYIAAEIPTIVLAGYDYGMGSSRDWAAKGTFLLGIKAVIAVSFERIHRSNLVGMGVLPLQFKPGENADYLKLTGNEIFNIFIDDKIESKQKIQVEAISESGEKKTIIVVCRLDSPVEIDYYRQGGILQAELRKTIKDRNSDLGTRS